MAIYMKFDGIDGQVTTKGYEKWIELESFQQNIQRDTKNPSGGGAGGSARKSSAPKISGITVTKLFDKASTKIIQEAVAGTFEKKAEIVWTTTSKNQTDTFLTVTLTDCGITSYDMGSRGGDGQSQPTEFITLNFSRIEWRATPLDNKGKQEVQGAFGYDLVTRQAV